jgi:hypothetical protein
VRLVSGADAGMGSHDQCGRRDEGDTITIFGTNFSNATHVTFNGTAVPSLVSATVTQVRVVVPTNATTGNIQVTDNGSTATSASTFTVDQRLAAAATVTELAAIPATPNGARNGIRMVLIKNGLYITGPSQDAVYRMDLTTNAVTTYLSIPTFAGTPAPVGIASGGLNDSSFLVISVKADYSDPKGDHFFTYRSGSWTDCTSSLHQMAYSLKSQGSGFFVATDVSNRIFQVTIAGSAIADAFANTQLLGIPNGANTTLGISSSGVNLSVFANHALWRVQTDNTLTLLAGQSGVPGYADGAAALFQDGGSGLGNPIAVGDQAVVYVADYGSGTIRKVDNTGTVTTVAGNQTLNPALASTPSVGRGDRMRFRFGQGDMILGSDGKNLYVISLNSKGGSTPPYSVYKVVLN